MKDRIKEVRKSAGCSQTKFGERVGVSMSAVQKWELGLNQPDAASIRLICQEYGVNETWLRTGEGDMKIAQSREQEMATLVSNLMADSTESFRIKLVTALLRFDPEGPEWEVLERIYESIAAEAEKAPGEYSSGAKLI